MSTRQPAVGESAPAMPMRGEPAPDFTLQPSPGQSLRLSDLSGHPVILAFYPADWSPVCSDQIALYQAVLPVFEEYGAKIVGLSVDGCWCHQAFAKSRSISFPLLADFEPKGAVSRRYGSYNPT